MVAITGPINWVEVNCPHQKQVGSFAPSIQHRAGNNSSYVPRFDYGTGIVDSGNTPASRTQASVSASTSVTISYCTFAQGDINLSNMRLTSAGLLKFLSAMQSGNAAQIQYDFQGSLYCHADTVDAEGVIPTAPAPQVIKEAWSVLSGKGWTRTGAYSVQRIIFTVQTTTTNETFAVPLNSAGTTYKLDIDWGDGSVSGEVTSGTDTRLTHTYAVGGTYTITLIGTVLANSVAVGFTFQDTGTMRLKVRSVIATDCDILPDQMWAGCTGMTGSVPQWRMTPNRMYATYKNCTGLTGMVPRSMPRITDVFQQAFDSCSNIVAPFPSIHTACTGIYYAFRGCSKMYGPHPYLPPSLTNMDGAFNGCTSMTGGITLTGLTALTSMNTAFQGCTGLTGTIVGVSGLTALTSANNAFMNCYNLTGTISTYPASIVNIGGMYGSNGGISMKLTGTFPTTPAGVTAMNGTYQACAYLTGPAPNIPNAVTNLNYTFEGCAGMTTFPTLPTSLTTMIQAFTNCIGAVGALPASWPTGLVIGDSAYYNCPSVSGTVPAFGAITSTYSMFRSAGISGFTIGTTNFTFGNFSFFFGDSMPNLTAAAIDNFLVWLDTRGPTTGTLNYSLSSGTAHLDASRSPAGLTAKNNLITKGWTRSGTY